MSESFSVSPVRVRPGDGEQVVVESGDRQTVVPLEEELIRTKNPGHPIGMRVIAKGPAISDAATAELEEELSLDSATDASSISSWIESLDTAPGRLDVHVDAAEVTADQLRPLMEVSNRHGLDIDLKLHGDG